jgi:predicted metalloprotease with PDZ domain
MAQAIPIQVVEKVSSEIIAEGKVARGWLGVLIGQNEEKEVEIVDVEEDSPAEKSNLEEGDIILEFDGEEVVGSDMLQHEIRMKKPGDKVTLKIERDGSEKDVEVELGEYTEQDIFKNFERQFPQLFPTKPDKLIEAPKSDLPKAFQFVTETRKYIGVSISELNRDLSRHFGVEKGLGLMISKVSKDSPAEKAGLKVGDIIVRADGKRLESLSALRRMIQKKKEGDKIKIEYIRNRQKKTVEVEVEKDSGGERFLASTVSPFKDLMFLREGSWTPFKKLLDQTGKLKYRSENLYKELLDKPIKKKKKDKKLSDLLLKKYRCIKV